MKAVDRKAVLERVFATLGDLSSAEILHLLRRAPSPAELRKLDEARAGSRVVQTGFVRELDSLRQRIEAARDPEALIPPVELARLQGRITAALAGKAQSGPPVILPDGVRPDFPEWFREMRLHMEAGEWPVALGFSKAALRSGLVEEVPAQAIPYVWQDLALVHYYSGLLPEAERLVRKAILEADERQATAVLRGSLRCVLGIILAKRGDGTAALEQLTAAEEISPGHWHVPFNRFAVACLVLDEVGMANAAGRLEQLARDRGRDGPVGEMLKRLREDRDFDRARTTRSFALLMATLEAIFRPDTPPAEETRS